jgi:hypothetical protein
MRVEVYHNHVCPLLSLHEQQDVSVCIWYIPLAGAPRRALIPPKVHLEPTLLRFSRMTINILHVPHQVKRLFSSAVTRTSALSVNSAELESSRRTSFCPCLTDSGRRLKGRSVPSVTLALPKGWPVQVIMPEQFKVQDL